MSIQLFTPNFRVEECLEEVRECLEKGWTGLGFKTQEIEEKWKEYTKLPYAHFLSSATAGLHLALEIFKRENGWDNDDEVITTPLTFISTNHAILYADMKPVFADVDEYLCLCPESVEKAITSKTKALIFVGIGGNAGQYNRIRELCTKHNIKLVLDAAHMAGTRINGNHAGFDADVSVFSFQAVKNLPTADSGMICFQDEALDKRARKLSWLGIDKDTFARSANKGAYKWRYDVDEIGYKYHGNSIMAGLALVGLKYLDRDNAFRRQLASWYRSELKDCDGLTVVPVSGDCESSHHLIQIRVQNRDSVLQKLNDAQIYPGVHYSSNIEYGPYKRELSDFPKSTAASNEIISLPMHMNLTFNDVVAITTELKRIVSAS
ncbi:DegT/DnrJ/EryC1/StrS family aminotransferase [Pleionea litopenaei]|uniref:DegT/DnrJ/EryC1/StrS family aminotransferase n=1 Tax=Pleionea litopenaei TaxID=3070815 RepID=A0AA51X6M3_9GAMM|nr:DegT/DnrJ/EryC1/StrS family aminotransferase [Pleionea sp. HL-JVS1]WMS87278.1 DegT/DnrJ/EryC1/StrS family aminotransferase [Pleionea sp. HL-JVS1]